MSILPLQPSHVLLVEDEPAHLRLIRRAFELAHSPHRLSTAANLNDSRELLSSSDRPDLIVADLILPDGKGTDLLPDSSCPLVVMTSHGDEQTAVEAIKAGALDYVVKSESTFNDLPHIADRALREWRRMVEYEAAIAALRESDLRFRQIAENVRDVIYLCELHPLRIIYVSPSYVQIWGRTVESLLGNPRSWVENIHPDDRARVVKELARYDAEYQDFDQIFRIIRPDGTVRWIHDRTFVVRDEAGQPHRVTGLAADITERKREEDRKRERSQSRERLLVLTRREREVLERVADGKPNKVIAKELDIRSKTVEMHRANVMKKLQMDNVAELVRLVISSESSSEIAIPPAENQSPPTTSS